MSHWYCNNCEDQLEGINVTFEEKCVHCGDSVIWVDKIRGTLFNKTQGDFYELTGQRPLIHKDGNTYAKMNYVRYLEDCLS